MATQIERHYRRDWREATNPPYFVSSKYAPRSIVVAIVSSGLHAVFQYHFDLT